MPPLGPLFVFIHCNVIVVCAIQTHLSQCLQNGTNDPREKLGEREGPETSPSQWQGLCYAKTKELSA